MYYTNKPLDKDLNADIINNYITANRWFIFNKFKTYSTFERQIFEYPNKVNQQIIDLTYTDKKGNDQL